MPWCLVSPVPHRLDGANPSASPARPHILTCVHAHTSTHTHTHSSWGSVLVGKTASSGHKHVILGGAGTSTHFRPDLQDPPHPPTNGSQVGSDVDTRLERVR